MLDLLPDLFDEHANELSLAAPIFNDYGGKNIFFGEIVTVSCYNDNSKVKELVATDGTNKVMVVDGCIRDAGTIATLALGVKALGCCPIKTEKLGIGEINLNISFAGLDFTPGYYIYGDSNGLAISKTLLSF